MNIFYFQLFSILWITLFSTSSLFAQQLKLPSKEPVPTRQLQLVSTESDPDAFIQHSVNVINGEYCEATTDLIISGPDPLVLQRFYSTKDPITGNQSGGWRMLPQRFLVIKTPHFELGCPFNQGNFTGHLHIQVNDLEEFLSTTA